jgi:hypothetical protein
LAVFTWLVIAIWFTYSLVAVFRVRLHNWGDFLDRVAPDMTIAALIALVAWCAGYLVMWWFESGD